MEEAWGGRAGRVAHDRAQSQLDESDHEEEEGRAGLAAGAEGHSSEHQAESQAEVVGGVAESGRVPLPSEAVPAKPRPMASIPTPTPTTIAPTLRPSAKGTASSTEPTATRSPARRPGDTRRKKLIALNVAAMKGVECEGDHAYVIKVCKL